VLRGDSDVALRYVRGPDGTQIARLRLLVAGARDRLRRFDEVQLLWIPRHRNAMRIACRGRRWVCRPARRRYRREPAALISPPVSAMIRPLLQSGVTAWEY
jgi:hypothetical protein